MIETRFGSFRFCKHCGGELERSEGVAWHWRHECGNIFCEGCNGLDSSSTVAFPVGEGVMVVIGERDCD